MEENTLSDAVLEALEDGVCIIDQEWRIRYVNPAAARHLTTSRSEAIGRTLAAAFPLLASPTASSCLEHAMRSGIHDEFMVEALVDEPPSCWRVRVAPIASDRLAVYLHDATQETRVARHHARLLEAIGDGFVALDARGAIVYLNRMAERVLRLSRAKTEGELVWSLLPKRFVQLEAALRATAEDGRPRVLRRLRAGRAGNRCFDVRIHPLPGGGTSILFRDVTRVAAREHDLACYAAEAEEANRAKSRFFAAVSHELRTPLNALVGYTHLLTTDTYGTLPESATRAASRAGVCAEHLARLVDDLLLLTTTEISRLPVAACPLDLAEFLPAAVEPNRQQAEAKGLRFSVAVAGGMPRLVSDPDRLRQLLNALLSNAVRFTSRGEVRLEATLASAHGNGSEGSAAAGPGRVRLRVIDTGPGIPVDEHARIFEAFEQLGNQSRSDAISRGPGLGLTIARHLATLLDGTLDLERSDATGSVFALELPLWSGDGEPWSLVSSARER